MDRIRLREIIVRYNTAGGEEMYYKIFPQTTDGKLLNMVLIASDLGKTIASKCGFGFTDQEIPSGMLTKPEPDTLGNVPGSIFDDAASVNSDGSTCYLVGGQVVCPPGHPLIGEESRTQEAPRPA